MVGGHEMAFHLTGRYPEWWQGKRFDGPIDAWCGALSHEVHGKSTLRILLGRNLDEPGTGTIPKADIVEIVKAPGVANGVDSVVVKHASGGTSRLSFKTYEQGREKWQAATIDLIWFDEEPPADVYSEGLFRTKAKKGMVYVTFTPLKGMTEVVSKFYPEPDTEYRHTTVMTIHDVEHYSEEEKKALEASFPAHERKARLLGVPTLGEGAVFPLPEEQIMVQPFEIPAHFRTICGIDFGWTHPTAAVQLCLDGDNDVVYLTKTYRQSQREPTYHASVLKAWGDYLWAWPHDGEHKTAGNAGQTLAVQYRNHGLNMLPERAKYPDGSYSLEGRVMDMLDRMQTGRFKVFSTCQDWLEEFRLYHRNNGLIVPKKDDLISASQYALMSLRFAVPSGSKGFGGRWGKKVDYNDSWII